MFLTNIFRKQITANVVNGKTPREISGIKSAGSKVKIDDVKIICNEGNTTSKFLFGQIMEDFQH